MFKKLELSLCKHNLGNKDRKRIKSLLCSTFDNLSEDILQSILPKNSDIVIVKNPSSKCNIYYCKDRPILFEKDSIIYPVLSLLWKYPNLLPSFVLYPTVSHFVLKGADVMLPGIMKPKSLDVFGKSNLFINKPMVVRIFGNPYPIAVGRCLVTNESFNTGKGKALEVLHVLGDCLTETNELPLGLSLKTIEPCPSVFQEDENVYSSVINSSIPLDLKPPPSTLNLTEQTTDSPIPTENKKADSDIADSNQSISHSVIDSNKLTNCLNGDFSSDQTCSVSLETKNGSNTHISIPPLVMDIFLEFVLLETLHTEINDTSLPLDVSAVYNHMIKVSKKVQCHPIFLSQIIDKMDDVSYDSIANKKMSLECDFKQSSSKRLMKFFQVYGKKKLIDLKDSRNTLTLLSIKRQSPLYIKYTPVSQLCPNQDNHLENNPLLSENNLIDSEINDKKKALKSEILSVCDLYSPTSFLDAVFKNNTSPEHSHVNYYTKLECQHILSNYLESNCQKNKDTYILDKILKTALCTKKDIKLNQDGQPSELVELTEPIILQRFLSKLSPYYKIEFKSSDPKKASNFEIIKGKFEPVQITLERRQGTKYTTTITNIHIFKIDPKQLSETLQKKFASSCTLSELPGKVKGSDKLWAIMIQGSFIDNVLEILTNQYKVPRNCIAVNNLIKN